MNQALRDMLCGEHEVGNEGYALRARFEEGEGRVFCDEENVPYKGFVS